MAEWGYVDIKELLENGAYLDRKWEPCTYREAMKKIRFEEEQEVKRFDESFKLRRFGKAKNPKLDDFG